MGRETHRVLRQTVELSVDDDDLARALHSRIGELQRRSIEPLLERLCDEVSDPTSLHRIDRLELDLGRIDPLELERDLLARLERALRSALAESVRTVDRTTPHVELIAMFLRSGTLPWWADATRPDAVASALRTLAHDAPDALVSTVRTSVARGRSLARLVRSADDATLAVVCTALSPSLQDLPDRWIGRFVEILTATPHVVSAADAGPSSRDRTQSPSSLRVSTWVGVLEGILASEERPSAPRSLARGLLVRCALEAETTYRELVARVIEFPFEGSTVDASIREVAGELSRELASELRLDPASEPLEGTTGDAADDRRRAAAATSAVEDVARIRRLLGRLAAVPGLPRELLDDLRRHAERLPESLHVDWVATLRRLERRVTDVRTARAQLSGLVRSIAPHDVLRPGEVSSWLAELERDESTATLPGVSPDDFSFSDADSVHVENAGLVILWPFLGRFFAHTGLVADDAFVDAEAVHRGVALLQHLATGEPTFREYALPLDKILCGMDPDDVFDPGEPITDDESAECERLLRAVVENAPILKNMSTPALRATFLLRHGSLAVAPGSWVLHVEGETYDVVLERFPWSWSWVKLPWMQSPLRVEW